MAQLQQDDDLQDEGAKADDFADHGIKATGTSLAGAEGAMSKGVAVSVGQSQMSQMAALREAADVQGAQGIGTTSEGDIQAARDNDASMTQLEKEQEQEKQRQQEQEAEERRRHREQQALALQREMEIARQRDQERERAREREEAEAKEAARLLAEAEAFLAAEEKARMAALHEQEARYAQEAEVFLAAEEQKRKAADHRQEALHKSSRHRPRRKPETWAAGLSNRNALPRRCRLTCASWACLPMTQSWPNFTKWGLRILVTFSFSTTHR